MSDELEQEILAEQSHEDTKGALNRGHDWQKDPALVSPGDVAEHFGVPRA